MGRFEAGSDQPADRAVSSTVEKGNRFRDSVAAALRTKYPDAETEIRIGHKKVDVVFSRFDLGRTDIIGVGCKDCGATLTMSDVNKIYADHDSLVRQNLLHHLIVVASGDVTADARAFINNSSWMRFRTFNQLEEDLLGLRPYIESIAASSDERELGSYYVEGRFEGQSGIARDYVHRWLGESNARPLAILGGYGRGKSSLALRIVSSQARAYLKDATERMPILVRLGKVVHETQLEGLFGKEFTAHQPSHDFKFRTLEHLNEMGRLFIVLDGFDEMKHAMSASDFRSNFREFNRLLRPEAKVLLLGRPNALTTEARQLVFRGQRIYNDQVTQDPHYRKWTEITVDSFNDAEIEQFLRTYLIHRMNEAGRRGQEEFVERRVKEIRREVAPDLLSRPVHAKIVADLAVDPSFNLQGFTPHTLYAQFIQRLVERDVDEKQARSQISVEDRLTFQRELAWWCWSRNDEGQGFFERDQVPLSLLDGLPNGGAVSNETKLAEYLVSTLTEEKDAGVLYFAHRSFQEFLVTERLRLLTPSADQHVQIAASLTPDIIEFLDAAPDHDHITRWYETIGACPGPLPAEYLRYFQINHDLVVQILESGDGERMTVADVAIIGLAPLDDEASPSWGRKLINVLAEVITVGKEDPATMAIACLLRLHLEDSAEHAIEALAVSLLVRIVQRMKDADESASGILIPGSHFGTPERICAAAFSKLRDQNVGRMISIDTQEALSMAAGHLIGKVGLIARSPERTSDEVRAGELLAPEFCSGLSYMPAEKKVSIPVNTISGLIRDDGLKQTVARVMRHHGQRFDIVEFEARRRRPTHAVESRYAFGGKA
ncbi:NACHT domain-containing protein [Paraburkholderia sediminicola]|uniref:NACHT domain-containing protein n=1 Tax=Paraburkholderia sediminicola TaxID=458836 RepID=UPI0038B91DA8